MSEVPLYSRMVSHSATASSRRHPHLHSDILEVSASERRGGNLTRFEDFYLKVNVRVWP
jgi:hypothetical protein